MKIELAKGLILFCVVLIIFYLSPFSEVTLKTKCYSLGGLIENPAGADIQPLCSSLISGESYQTPIFPFKEKTNGRIEICKKTTKNVEKACGNKINDILIDDFTESYNDTFTCYYVILNSSDKSIKKYIVLEWFSQSFLESDLGKTMNVSQFEINEINLDKADSVRCKNLNESIVYR
jgi:hypothetical protein